MKICFITGIYPPTSLGGPGEVVYNLQKYFLECGAEAYVFTCGAHDRRYPYTIRTPCGKRLFIPLSPFYYFKEIRKMQFDILNIHSESGMGIAPLLFFRNKPKIVTTLHSEYLEESKVRRSIAVDGLVIAKPSLEERLTKYFFTPIKFAGTYMDMKVSDRIIAVSEKTKKAYLRQRQISEEKISVIYNGVDSQKFSPKISGGIVREKYSIGTSPVILVVGRGIIAKGCFFVFFALKEIVKIMPDVKLMIVGSEGKYKEQMISIIKNLEIQANVVLVERVPNYEMPYYYSSSDVVVLPSLLENFPIVALEALSSGKPVIASRVGGIPEVVKNNENGILVDPANVDQMVDALLCLLEDSSMRNSMGNMGRKLVEEKFDWKKIGREYLKEFEKLL